MSGSHKGGMKKMSKGYKMMSKTDDGVKGAYVMIKKSK